MLLVPKKTKFKKQQRGRRKGIAQSGNSLYYGDYGIKATEGAWITARQIEAVRVSLSRMLGKGAKVWIRIFPDKPVTKKPAETRQGKGKGNVELWVAVVKRGKMLFEFSGVSEETAREAYRKASRKLSVATRFVSRTEGGV
ncbi:MAG: 50S ribosomal protein L16 [candidate division WOR-3 bacterium]